MKRRSLLLLLIGLFAVVILLVVLWIDRDTNTAKIVETIASKPNLAASSLPSQQPSLPLPERRKMAVDKVLSMLSTPITFYGKAVDQFGKPVVGATVEYGAADKFMESGSDYTSTTDGNGLFGITNIVGAYLTVGLRKDGYDPIDGKSTGSFGYGSGPDSQRKAPPTKDNPATFILRKKTEAEPLYFVSSRQYDIQKNGTSIEINLQTGKLASSGTGHIAVGCSVDNQEKDNEGRFSWKCSVSVPNGGLQERNPEYDFSAPDEGYQPAIEITMEPSEKTQKWKSQIEKQYFLKLANGCYARVSLNIYVGDRIFIVLESYYNPKIGSRYLEYDSSKVIP